MRHLSWLTIFGFVGLAIVRIQAQPASQEQVDQARDVLRNTPSGQPATAATLPAGTNAAPVPSGGIGTLTPEMEKQARELLQNMRNRSRPAAFPGQSGPAPVTQTNAAAREAAFQQALAEARRIEEERRIAAEKNLAAGQEKNVAPDADREKRLAEIEAAVERARQDRATRAPATTVPPPVTETVATAAPPVAPGPATTPATPVAAPGTPVVAPAPVLQVPSPRSPGLTPEQEQKARELLNQKLNEIQPVPPVVAAPATPAAPPAVPSPVAVTAPPASVPTVVSQPAAVPSQAVTVDKEAQVRALLEQKVAELYSVAPAPQSAPAIAPPAAAPPPVVASPPPVVPAPAAVPTPATAPAPATVQAPAVAVPPLSPQPPAGGLTPEAEAQARELLQKQWSELDTTKAPSPAEDPKSQREAEKKAKREMEKLTTEANAKARAEARKRTEAEAASIAEARAREQGKAPSAKTSSATGGAIASAEPLPSSGLSGSKQQRLAALLEAYKQGNIAPAEYHEKRAKILAEP